MHNSMLTSCYRQTPTCCTRNRENNFVSFRAFKRLSPVSKVAKSIFRSRWHDLRLCWCSTLRSTMKPQLEWTRLDKKSNDSDFVLMVFKLLLLTHVFIFEYSLITRPTSWFFVQFMVHVYDSKITTASSSSSSSSWLYLWARMCCPHQPAAGFSTQSHLEEI